MSIETVTIHKLFGVRIDDISSEILKNRLTEWLDTDRTHVIFTPNPEFLLEARTNLQFAEMLNKSDLSLPDGTGIKFAVAALSDSSLQNRQTGVDTLFLLAQICAEKKKKLLLLGGDENVAEDTKKKFEKEFPSLVVHAINPGVISGSLKEDLLLRIKTCKPDVIAVALGAKKQEQFILDIQKNNVSFKIAIGVGGAFDILSGRKKRAPEWMRRSGLEWVWRVFLEPRRIHRILRATIVFPILVVIDTLKHRRFLLAIRRVFREIYNTFSK